MNLDVKAKWIAALRSGEYKQGYSYLHYINSESNEEFFCCLGVLCDLGVKAGAVTVEDISVDYEWVEYGAEGSVEVLPDQAMDWSGLDSSSPAVTLEGRSLPVKLADLNDRGSTFGEIADLIEKHL